VRSVAALCGGVVLAACATVPPAPPGELEYSDARYTCADGTAFTARFDRLGEGATLTFERADPDDPDATSQDRDFRIVLSGQPAASGMWYQGSGWSLRGKGDAATLTRPDGRSSACAASGAPPAPETSI
jgi:membrane-bound inhibitor of C-type lysozyme